MSKIEIGYGEALQFGVPQGTYYKDDALEAENARLKEELAAAEKDAERLDFLEQRAIASRTGVSIDYARHVEDGYMTEKGYRVMWFHRMHGRAQTLRLAIDAAMQAQQGEKK